MPYIVELPDGRRVEFPDSVPREQASQIIQAQFYSKEQQPPAPQEETGILRQALDVPVQVASGIATGVRLITDSFGANNPVSQNIRGVEGFLQNLLSAQAKNNQQEVARIMEAAEDQGIGAQLRAALQSLATAPVDLIANAAGTAVPTIAGGLAAQALKLSVKGAMTGVGAVMGAGTIKSSIYDEVKQTLTDLGASPEEAEKKAVLAQEYGGENLDQILLGTVIGGVAGRFGIEPAVAKQIAGNIAQKSIGKAALQEAAPETAQAAQEQIAQNIALQREGMDVPTFRGAVGAGALEGLVGGVLGGGIEAFRPEAPPPAVTTEEPPPPPPEGEAPPPAPTAAQTQLLTDIEEADEAAADEERKKFEATVQKITEGETGTALNIARAKVQESGKTAAPYIMNAVNANLPGDMTPITMSQASQIRQQLVGEGIIEGKDKVRKAAVTEQKVEPIKEVKSVESEKPSIITWDTIAPGQEITLYRGENAGNQKNGEWWTTDRDQARKFGTVTEITLPSELVGKHSVKGQGGPQEFVFPTAENRPPQLKAAAKAVETEIEDAGTTDTQPPRKAEPTGRGERVAPRVSSEPLTDTQIDTAAKGQVATETDGARVDSVSDTVTGSVAGEERSSTPLNTEKVEAPYDRYDSLQRRLEGLVNARRVQPIIANRIRTNLKQGNPVTNPDTYQAALDQAEQIIDKFEKYAEDVESGDSVQSMDRRQRRLKEQEQNALQRAQSQIAQNKIAESLKDRRARTDYDEDVLPQYAQDMREAMDRGSIRPITQILTQNRTAVDVYPGKGNEKFREAFKVIARKLNSINFSNVKVQTEATVGADIERFKRLKDEAKYAEYDPSNNTLYMRRDRIYGNIVAHELIHAATVEVIRKYELDGLASDTQQADEQLALAEKVGDKDERESAVQKAKARVAEVASQKLGVQRLMNVYELSQSQVSDPSLVREYSAAFENLYEFVAIGLTNPQFQNRLARIEVPLTIGRKNLWTEFVKAVGNLFGFNIKSTDGVSALDEVGQAFSEMASAPSREGVTGVKPLAAKKAEGEPPPIDPVEEARKKRELIMGKKLTLKGLFKDRMSAKGASKLVKNFQDRQRYIYELQRDLDRSRLAIWGPPNQSGNTLAAANDEATGKYENYEKVVMPLIHNLNDATRAFAAKLGKPIDEASDIVDGYLTSKANLVRRVTNYIKEKPLKTKPTIRLKGSDKLISYAQYRDMLIDSVLTTEKMDPATRQAINDRLMQLVGLEIGPDGKPRRTKDAAKYEDPLGASYAQMQKKEFKPKKRELDFFHPYYDNIKDYGYKVDDAMVSKIENDPVINGPELKAIRNALRKLDEVTQRFNEEANHLTQPAKNVIELYGWGDDYVPLMGKVQSESGKRDQFVYLNTVPNEMIRAFGGRADAPDSPIIMTMINAGKAATRAAKADIVPTLVNLMKPHPKNGKQIVKGEMVGTITFAERFKGDINFEETDSKGTKKWVGQDKFYNYLDNGDIEVWRVDDKEVVQALRPDWEPDKTLFPRFKQFSQYVTSIIGQGHTRYQVKFAPYDFPRNVFANAGITMAELGPLTGLKYLSTVGTEVFINGRLPQMWRLSKYHSNNDQQAIRRMGGYDPKTGLWKDPFIRDAARYLERGGKISIIRTWQGKEKLQELIDISSKSLTRQKFEEMIKAAQGLFDRWLDMFEFTARVQAYRVSKAYAENVRGLKDEASELFAVNYTKNLANFEKRGLNEWAPALFAFFSPAATGAVRAMDAIAPALRLTAPRVIGGTKIQSILNELPEEIRSDPEAIKNYTENYLKQRNAGLMAMAYFSAVGYMGYYIARSLGALVKDAFDDEDEEPKNPIAADSKELWVRNLRIPLEWLDIPQFKGKYLQIPWGFGIGAFGAAGAQLAALQAKDQSMTDFAGNMVTIAVDSYLPLPVARYNPFHGESLFAWVTTSLSPTVIRPLYELELNKSGLGDRIYRSYYNKYGPAYAGSENIEEIYRDAALIVRDVTLGKRQPEPNEIRYLTTAYFDGYAAMASDLYNWMLLSGGVKDLDIKTDLVVLDNFIGNKITPSIPKFVEATEKLDEFKRRYDSFINDPDSVQAERFYEKYPEADAIVAIYNQHVNRARQLRRLTTYDEVHADTPRERKAIKEMNDKDRDVLRKQTIAFYEEFKDQIK
jgi:hypothetical protein